MSAGPLLSGVYWCASAILVENVSGLHWSVGICIFYCEKIRVFKAGLCLNTLAWNNKIGLWFYFVGF